MKGYKSIPTNNEFDFQKDFWLPDKADRCFGNKEKKVSEARNYENQISKLKKYNHMNYTNTKLTNFKSKDKTLISQTWR